MKSKTRNSQRKRNPDQQVTNFDWSGRAKKISPPPSSLANFEDEKPLHGVDSSLPPHRFPRQSLSLQFLKRRLLPEPVRMAVLAFPEWRVPDDD